MNIRDEIIERYFQSINLFDAFESKPREYGTGDLLYPSEIHTLVMIAKNPGLNLTQLADFLGISKSGASKFVKKLLAKKLIVKGAMPENLKEVVFDVTEKGVIAFEGHQSFSANTFVKINEIFNQMNDDEMKVLHQFLGDLISVVREVDV
jgi:DNA-binding MarR family transcriptional regulator